MVHTAEITYFPDGKLIEEFRSLETSVWYAQDHVWYNGSLKDQGLKFRLKFLHRRGYISVRLICRVNFSKLLHPDDKISMMTAWDVDTVEDRFNNLINGLLPTLPPFECWSVNRIDYCVNVHTPYVEEYLRLMKKGDRFHMKDWYNRNNRNYSQQEGSLYLVSTAKKKNRGVTINFYDKYDEMVNSIDEISKLSDDENEEMEFPKDILRLEVQCHKIKTEHLRKKYKMPRKTIKYFLDPYITHELISSYIKRIAGTADYQRRSVALDMIYQTSCRQATKEKLKQIIMDVGRQHNSVAKVREKRTGYSCYMKRDEFNRLIRTLQQHNINPVTIRDTSRLEGKTLKQGLPSIYSLFEEAFQDTVMKNA